MFRRGEPRFYAFDLLSCNGETLRYLPLTDRKHRLQGVAPGLGERFLYCDHLEGRGEHLFRLACKRGREKLFERGRATDPNWHDWNAYALVADQAVQGAHGEAALLCMRLFQASLLAGALLAVVWR